MSRHVDEMEISDRERKGEGGESEPLDIHLGSRVSFFPPPVCVCFFCLTLPCSARFVFRKIFQRSEIAVETIGLSQSAQIQSVQEFTFWNKMFFSVLPRHRVAACVCEAK